jgi:membrane protein YqaA with SNARE-associated domain
MARQYAVILGMLAFSVVQFRAMWHRFDMTANLWQGIIAMMIFATVGAVIGGVAEWILGQELRREFADQMVAAQQNDNNRPRTKTT